MTKNDQKWSFLACFYVKIDLGQKATLEIDAKNDQNDHFGHFRDFFCSPIVSMLFANFSGFFVSFSLKCPILTSKMVILGDFDHFDLKNSQKTPKNTVFYLYFRYTFLHL